MRRLVFASLLLGFALPALADPAPDTSHVVHATLTASGITVDGVLNEPVWQTAPACSNFVQRDPVEGARPSQRTVVRVRYDRDALYVGARMYDSSPDSIVSELSRRDGGTRSDRFFIYLDPYYDRRSGYYFAVNAAGTQFDGTLYNDGWSDDSWDGVWEGKARRDAQGWTVEMRIPFSQLRFSKAEAQRWGINFCREMGRGFENIYYVCRPRKSGDFVSLFPTLTGIEHVRPTSAIEILPYGTSKVEVMPSGVTDPFHTSPKTTPNGGGDLRMPMGGKLTLNATVNPDFGQVEVDPAVVNLSDVETFFPEKRPFFVEGSSIFDAGQQGATDYWGFNFPQPTFFYSRRIGHAPEGALPDNTAYSDVPTGTTILGAAKLSGKISQDVNFGTLSALTSRENAQVQLSDNTEVQPQVEPLAYYGVARALKEFPERRNGLGLLTTFAYRDLSDPTVRDQFNRAALAGIVDGWHFLDHGKVWALSGWAGGSLITGTATDIANIQTDPRHYFQRPDAKSYSFDPGATSLAGSGARVWLNKEKGNWLSNSAIGYIGPGFEVNDMGFESRADIINEHLGGGYRWTEPTKHVKNHMLLGAVFASQNFDGDLTSAGVWGRGFWWYTNNWTFNSSFAYNPETVNPRRSRGGPLMLNKPGYEINLFGDTDGSRKRYYNVSFYEYLQPEENSFVYSFYPYFTYKPASNIKLDIGPGYDSSRDGAFYVATIPDPAATGTYGSRYVFARLDQQMISANIRLNVSFTPTMSLQFYGQPLIAVGRYSDYKELARPKSLDFIGPGAGAWTYDPATGEFDPDGPVGPTAPTVNDFNTKSLRGNAVFRWEYMPGSALYLVWTQQRSDYESTPEFNVGPSFSRLLGASADNIFLAKLTYYMHL